MLHGLVRCRGCGAPLSFSAGGERNCCRSPAGSILRSGFLIHDPQNPAATPEMLVRDQDAFNYVSHPKFPTQVARLERFIRSHAPTAQEDKVLDLGCGPGPTTQMLLKVGYNVVAVDFSIRSLSVNAQSCGELARRALFVDADLNTVAFENAAFDGLMMADFLQHLGDREIQRAFLHKIFQALKPGGWFYLSFFNTNFVHRLKGDLAGVRGGIGYCRMSLGEVRAMIPDGIRVEKEAVMNIAPSAGLDQFVSQLPFASLLAQMAVIEGRKQR